MSRIGDSLQRGGDGRAPEYFPGLDYFADALVEGCLVLNTSIQYSRQSFQNRCKIRKPDGVQWITVPLSGGQFGSSIGSTRIDTNTNWARKHIKSLRFNYGSAPFYPYYIDAISGMLLEEWANLGELTCQSIHLINEKLDLGLSIRVETGETESTGAILSDSTSHSLQVMESESIEIRNQMPEYPQNFEGFISGMSILDLLFNCGPESREILSSVYSK